MRKTWDVYQYLNRALRALNFMVNLPLKFPPLLSFRNAPFAMLWIMEKVSPFFFSMPLFSKLSLGRLLCLLPVLVSRGKDEGRLWERCLLWVFLTEELCRASQNVGKTLHNALYFSPKVIWIDTVSLEGEQRVHCAVVNHGFSRKPAAEGLQAYVKRAE